MRVHFLRLCVVALAGVALACGKSDRSKSKEKGKPDASVAAAPKEEAVKLDAFWDDPSYVVIGDQAPCPEGWWALFGGDPPGATKEEQKANLARKDELKKALEAKTFLVHLAGGDEVTLGDYSNAKGELDINVKVSILCKSPSLENVAIAFGPVKAMLPPGRDFGQYFWLGDPVKYPIKLPFGQLAEFKAKHRLDLDARIVFKPGKVEQHKKLIRSTETAEEKAERLKHNIPGRAGGMDDWGAGWVMNADIKGVRLAADRGKTELAAIKR